MELAEMLRAVARQRRVFLIGVGLTIVLVVLTVGAFPPTYYVDGELLLVQGQETESGDVPVEPAVVAAVAESRGFGEDPPSLFVQMPYEIAPVEGSSVLAITTASTSRDDAVEGVDRLLETLDQTVQDLTADAGRGVDLDLRLLGRGVRSVARTTTGEDGATEPLGGLESGFSAVATVLVAEARGPDNPYSPSDYTANILSTLMNAPNNVDTYLAPDGVDEFAVITDNRRPAPILTVSVAGTDRADVLDTFATAESEVSDRLTQLQASAVDGGARPTTVQPLTSPDRPTLVENNVRRPLAVVLLLGLLVSAGAALSVDAWQLRRAQDEDPDEDASIETPHATAAADNGRGSRDVLAAFLAARAAARADVEQESSA